jgi:hypothetical protein
MEERGQSCMVAPSTRALGARSLCLRPWSNSLSSYVFSILVSCPPRNYVADTMVCIGMATTFPLVPPARSAARPPSVYAHVPLENVWRDE